MSKVQTKEMCEGKCLMLNKKKKMLPWTFWKSICELIKILTLLN